MKRFVAVILAVIVLAIGVLWLFSYLTSGKIIIKADDQDSITVSTTGKTPAVIKQATGILKASLKSGAYSVAVTGNSISASQIINIKAHTTLNLPLKPLAAKGVEPVIGKNAYSIEADSGHLLYADAVNGQLYQVDSQNTVTQPFGLLSFRIVKWADPNYGVGQDNNGNIYIISNQQVSILSSPGAGDSRTSYAVASDKTIYIAVKHNIYKYTGRDFIKIFTASTSYPLVEAGRGKLAVVDGADANSTEKASTPDLTVVSSAGTITKKIGTFLASWSPDSNYLVISSSSGAQVLDNSLKTVLLIPKNNINNVRWIDNQSFLFSINDQLWSYNLAGQKAQLIANMPLGATITEVSISAERNYAYLSVQFNNGNQLKRVGLKNQTVSHIISQLQDILPLTLDQCTLSLVNFSHPTVLVQSSTGPAQRNCDQTVRTELGADGFDLNSLQINFAS